MWMEERKRREGNAAVEGVCGGESTSYPPSEGGVAGGGVKCVHSPLLAFASQKKNGGGGTK